MSSLCSNEHLAFLVSAGLFLRAGFPQELDTSHHMVWRLRQQNLVSFQERHFQVYKGWTLDAMLAIAGLTRYRIIPLRPTGEMSNTSKIRAFLLVAKIAQVCKSIFSYEEQSRWDDSWKTSKAADFCRTLRVCWLLKLPGYDAAGWAGPGVPPPRALPASRQG